MNAWAEFLSLLLTWPTIVLGLGVVLHWMREALIASNAISKTAQQWLILGIFCGFLGGCFDNLYWGVAWSTEYLGWSCREWLFKTGSWPNIFFRQLAGVFAAYCHMRAFYEGHKTGEGRTAGRKKLLGILAVSCVLGAIYVAALYLIRYS